VGVRGRVREGVRRYGTVPHAGFGLGFERTLAYSPASPTCATPSPSRERRGMPGIDASGQLAPPKAWRKPA